MPRLLDWKCILDDQLAEESPCCACKGKGTDRYGDDCGSCGGFGVQI